MNKSVQKRVVFIGASKFGRRCLESLHRESVVKPVGVLTAPEQFNISYAPGGVKNYLHAKMDDFCSEVGIPLHTIGEQGMKSEAVFSFLGSLKPDLIIVVGWYHMVPKHVRELAPCVGLHASLLPKYAGGAPLTWAIINGERDTGISLFELEDGVDTGAIWAQAATPIEDVDTIRTVYDRIEILGEKILLESIEAWKENRLIPCAQNLEGRKVYPQRRPEDGQIDWKWSARVIYNFIRAQTYPYPGAFTIARNQELKIWASEMVSASSAGQVPGTVLSSSGLIATGNNEMILVRHATLEGKEVHDWSHLVRLG